MPATEPVTPGNWNCRMLVRPWRHPDESDAGYALRLAACNGLDRAAWVGDVDAALHERLRYCPHCLSGDAAYWREAWLNEPPICQEHAVWLVDECPQCQRAFTLNSVHFARCRCGATLSESPASPVSESVLASIKFNEPEMLTWLGALSVYGLQARPLKKRESRRVRLYSAVLEAGVEMTHHWPASFERLLQQWQQRTDSSPTLLNAVYPGLMRRIRSAPNRRWQERLLDTLNAYTEESRLGSRPILGKNAPPITTLAGVAKRLNMRTETVAATIDDMTPERAMLLPSGRRRRVITSALEDRLRTDLKARRSFSGAADYLGFSLGRLRLICDDGLLPVSSAVLSERDITNFEARLTRHATDAQVAELDHCVAHVLRTVVTRRETGPFLRAVMAGAISLRLKSNPYPVTRRLYMCIEDVQAWRSARRDSVALDFVSKEEARRFLNVKWEVLCHLIRHGHLRTIKRRTGRRCSEVVLIKELRASKIALCSTISIYLSSDSGSRTYFVAPRSGPVTSATLRACFVGDDRAITVSLYVG